MAESEKLKFVLLKESFSTGGYDFNHPSTIGFRKSRVRALQAKTELFELLPPKYQSEIDVIAYVDCDVLFAVEGCPTQRKKISPFL